MDVPRFLLTLVLIFMEPYVSETLSLEDIRKASSNFATEYAANGKEINCNDLIDYANNSSTCSSPPEVSLRFTWSSTYDKETRCFCALSVFQLMIPLNSGNISEPICTKDSTYLCYTANDCSTENQSSPAAADKHCIISRNSRVFNSTTERNESWLLNATFVTVFSGLSCVAFEDHREDICDVIYNGDSTTGATSNSSHRENNILFGSISLGIIICLIILIALITVVFCFINYKRKRRLEFLKKKQHCQSDNCAKSGQNYVSVGFIKSLEDEFKSTNMLLIERSDMKVTGELGQGAFGIVYKGILLKSGVDIAIKTLKDASTLEEMQEFISEATVMVEFDHPNVMALIGVCINNDDEMPMIVLPYMVNGDLKSFLLSSRRDGSVEILPEHLELQTLQSICQGIANGMEYLTDIKYVHRDLAARNCMIDKNLNVKVADFGFTRDIYGMDYYRLKRRTKLPVKWMAPECLLDNVFDEKTDVWSFGVVCWEVYSLGRSPYPGIDNAEVLDYVQGGNKLRKPFLCPQEMYSIIWACWTDKPANRPTFRELVANIGSLKEGQNLQPHEYFTLESCNH